jgi:hypothetical protein
LAGKMGASVSALERRTPQYSNRRFLVNVHLIPAISPALIVASPVFASGKCTSAAKSKWQPKEALEQQLKDQGYLVRRIKVEGECYEVYAFDKEGKRANMAYNAETLEKLDNPEAGEN